MKKEKILKFILLLAISFAVMRIYELMQYFVGVYVFGFKLDTPPNVSQAFFDTVCCSFQIAVFWILYMMTKRLYFDRGEDIEEVEETRLGIKDVPRLLPKLIVISLGVSGLVNLFMVFAENFLLRDRKSVV